MENAIRRLDALEGLNECEKIQIYVKLVNSLNSHLLDLITAANLKDEKLLMTLKCILHQPLENENDTSEWPEKLCCNLKELKDQQQILFIQQQQIQKAILEKLSQQEIAETVVTEADASSEEDTDETGPVSKVPTLDTPTISSSPALPSITPTTLSSSSLSSGDDGTKTSENKFSTKKIVNCFVITSIMLFIGFLGDYIPMVGKALSWLLSGYYLGWTLEQLTDVNSFWITIVSYVWKIDIFRRTSLYKDQSKTISSSSYNKKED